MAVCNLGGYLFGLAQNGQVRMYDEVTKNRIQQKILEITGYTCMCKGKGGQEIFFGSNEKVECWRLVDGEIQIYKSIQTRQKVNHLLALDHDTVLAVKD